MMEDSSFQTMLDTACDRLREKQIQYSIRKIKEMEETLQKIDQELDSFFDEMSLEESYANLEDLDNIRAP